MSTNPSMPNVKETRTPEDFLCIVEQARGVLAKLKPLDYDALYDELAGLNVKTSQSPHLQQLNSDLQSVQSAKDRVSEIVVDTMRHALACRRVADLLTEGWIKYSNENSLDKRKAEAALKMFEFENIAVEAETLHRAAQAVLKNLDSKHEATSRQITCFNLMLKLRDVGRTMPESGFLPEDFGEKTFGGEKIEQDLAPSPLSPIPTIKSSTPPVEHPVALTKAIQESVPSVRTPNKPILEPTTISPLHNADDWGHFAKG